MLEPVITGSGESDFVIERSAEVRSRHPEEEFCGLLLAAFKIKSAALLFVSVPLPNVPPGFLS